MSLLVGIDLGGTAAKLGLLKAHRQQQQQQEALAEAQAIEQAPVLLHSLRVPLPPAREDR